MSVPTCISYLELKRLKKKKAKGRRRRRRKRLVHCYLSSSFPVSPFPFVAPVIKISGEALEKRTKRIGNDDGDISKNGKKATG